MQFLQLLIHGVAQGCIYGLIALGLVLIYKATQTVSFAHGELMMLSALGGWVGTNLLGLPYGLAVLSTVVGMAGVGMLLERLVIRPLSGQPALLMAMLTLGIGYAVRVMGSMIPGIGTDTHVLAMPYQNDAPLPGSNGPGSDALARNVEHLVIIGVTSVLCVLLWALFRHTKLGLAMQAASQNPLAAHYMGIPVQRLQGLAWGLATALVAIAGILLASITFVHIGMGWVGLKAFPAAIVGGWGSLPGAVVGGIVIGLAESFAGVYLPVAFHDTAAYGVALVVLVVRPRGLFGSPLRTRA